MTTEMIQEIVDSALLSGIVETECMECGMTIQSETDASAAWCDNCDRIVKIKNPMIDMGFI